MQAPAASASPPLKSASRLLAAAFLGAAAVAGLLLLGRALVSQKPAISTAPTALDAASSAEVSQPVAAHDVADPGALAGSGSPAAKRPQIFPRAAGLKLPPFRLANVEPIEPHPRPVAPSPQATPTLPSAAPPPQLDKALGDAQLAYLAKDYNKAITLARSVAAASPLRAWRIIGSSACAIKDTKLAREAYQKLDGPARLYVVLLCQRNGLSEQDLLGAKP